MAESALLLEFIEQLHAAQQALLATLPESSETARRLVNLTPSLVLARAALEKQRLKAAHPDLALQIAVVGPTQSGKSSLVNLILGEDAAGVSPLAGFTVHPQAFLCGFSETGWLDHFFPGLERFAVADLPSRGDAPRRPYYDCYGAQCIEKRPFDKPCAVWDTPDFDSVRARVYLHGLLRVVALADVLVLVVSKDKYADEAVWDFLARIEPLCLPTLVCLNKVRPADRETLIRSFAEKWRSKRTDPCPKVLTLDYAASNAELKLASAPILSAIKELLSAAVRRRPKEAEHTKALFGSCFSAWTAPIRAELAAQERFEQLIDKALDQAVAIYRADFLDRSVSATTTRILAELLTLLEIPGIARPMLTLRRFLTWPVKTLLKKHHAPENTVQELVVLRRGVEHALLQLMLAVREQIQDQDACLYWWQALDQNLRAAYPHLLRFFEANALSYYQAFEPQVEAAALRLYQRLQHMPAALNSLRAARASADAAGLVLLLQTGGIGPHDLVLAPAMLSLTSLLAEGALGKYVDKVIAELKTAQLEAVKALIAGLGEEIEKVAAYNLGLNFPKSLLSEVEALLNKRSSYGLKLFSPATAGKR
nr:hypothetical protein HGMM_F03E05C15 [uncultured Gammaproteobacteria bacterium]